MDDTPNDSDQADTSTPAPRFEPTSGRSRLRGILRQAVWVFFVGVVLALVSNFIALPYYVLSPGKAIGVAKYVKVPDDKANPHRGDVFLTTVSVSRAHPLEMVWAWITPGTKIMKKEELLGDSTPKQFADDNRQAMDDSKTTAISVAMRRSGYPVTQLGDGAEVVQVADSSPSSGKLAVGDVVVGIDGTSVAFGTDLSTKTRAAAPGAVVRLDVLDAAGQRRTVDVTLGQRPDGSAGAYAGIVIRTKNPHVSTPFPVELTTTHIGGPSAGLAFTLALLDDLTPGDLTGGQKVAVTGTIAGDGTVGPVGGVEQKTHAVEKAGGKLFLVPSAEYDEAKRNAGKGLQVVRVDSLDQALEALRTHGGDTSGVPAVAPPAAPAA